MNCHCHISNLGCLKKGQSSISMVRVERPPSDFCTEGKICRAEMVRNLVQKDLHRANHPLIMGVWTSMQIPQDMPRIPPCRLLWAGHSKDMSASKCFVFQAGAAGFEDSLVIRSSCFCSGFQPKISLFLAVLPWPQKYFCYPHLQVRDHTDVLRNMDFKCLLLL